MKRIIFKVGGYIIFGAIVYVLLQKFGLTGYIRTFWAMICRAGVLSKIIGFIKDAYQSIG